MDGDSFMVRTEGPDGKLHDYEIKYTFGVTPLQQYSLNLPAYAFFRRCEIKPPEYVTTASAALSVLKTFASGTSAYIV